MPELEAVADRIETATHAASFVGGDGEMSAAMRAVDWASTPLGPIESWSPALRMMVGFMHANRFPLLLWWGPHYVSIYNDAYRPILGAKHPWAMGQPVSSCWSEIWHILQPLIDTPFFGGPATWMDDILLEINRYGFVEETHFTIAYSPVPDETAPRGIGGVLATVHEITEKVVGERRIAILRDLGACAAEAKIAAEACAAVVATLTQHPKDIPFALVYLVDAEGTRARLAGAAGTGTDDGVAPAIAELGEDGAAREVWPLARAMRTEQIEIVEQLGQHLAKVPAGPWSDPPHTAVVAPIPSNMPHRPAGFLVAGISPRLRFDEPYRSFVKLAATQIATAIANARAYEEERKRAEALAEIDRAKTAFFSNVSHEFRTPLTLMLGTLEQALAAELPDARRGELTIAHRNSLRLLRMVNTLLDFSRVEAGRIEASYEPVDLSALTAELASNFRSACERAGLRLDVICDPLPGPAFVDCDMWEKIVLNLLSNAFKFTLQGGITVRLTASDGHARLSVSDTGSGIPGQHLPRVFERFHRVPGTRGRTHEGTGIGLALVHELAKLHGGGVAAASEEGRGSTFTVSIPLGSAHLPADRMGAARRLTATSIRAQAFVDEALRWLPDGSDAPDLPSLDGDLAGDMSATAARRRVLVVDDNADMRDYVARLLRPFHDVDTAADGREALDAMARQRPDLVLSDVMMPVLDGFELVRAVRGDASLQDVPVILLSARAGEEAHVEGFSTGADDYLVKPFSARELLARINAHLQMAEMRRKALQEARAHEEALRSRTAELESALTVQRRAEAQRELLINELNHRVKNTLSSVQSIAMQTMRNAGSIGEFHSAFVSRLAALSRAHELLTRSNWEGASLLEMAHATLKPYGGGPDRIEIRGPDVRLNPSATLSLNMALHELATNAAKYGSLSVAGGRVALGWALEDAAAPLLAIRWAEMNGPSVEPPSKRGFGSRLIERGIARVLDAEVVLEFAPDGVRCHITLPLTGRPSMS